MALIEKEDVLHRIGELPLVWEYGQGVNDCYEIVKQAPTVDAIPVEWIRKYTEENRLYQSDDFDFYIIDMIADWKERKEE